MTSNGRVRAERSSRVRVTWSDADQIHSQSERTKRTSHDSQEDPATPSSRSWPRTSSANSVTKDPLYLKSTPSTNTVVTTAIVHAKHPLALRSPEPSVLDHEQGRADSDSDAQIDSMSSSDLEQCEELDNFELSPSPATSGDVTTSSGVHSKLSPSVGASEEFLSSTSDCSSSPSVAVGSDKENSTNDMWISGEFHVMSLRDFESLPPLWEDGGAGDFAGDDVEGSQWQMLGSGETVRVFHEQWGDTARDNGADRDEGEREEDIEQTLRNIYVSPFQDHHYSSCRSAPSHNPSNNHSTKRTKTVNFNPVTKPCQDQTDGASNDTEDEDDEDSAEDDQRSPRGQVEEYTSSLARVAERAVSGYRTCDDVESYVSTRKPRLILARAPPSPSGILRRTNRKVAGKVSTPAVHWADGRSPKSHAADDVT